jgi:hypothetical protein
MKTSQHRMQPSAEIALGDCFIQLLGFAELEQSQSKETIGAGARIGIAAG